MLGMTRRGRWIVTTTDLEVGVLLLSVTLSMGMSTLASGKLVALRFKEKELQ